MRIVVPISKIATIGGLEKHSWQVARLFADRGHEVAVLTTGPTGEFSHPRVEVESLGERPRLSIQHVRRFDRWCRDWLARNGADLIFGLDKNTVLTHYRATTGVHLAKLKQRERYVSRMHSLSYSLNPLHLTAQEFERQRFASGTLKRVFPNSNMVRDEILQAYDFPADRVQTVHNGVEWAALQEAFDAWPEGRASLLSESGVHPDRLQLLFVGSGFGRKGVKPLLDGVAQLEDPGAVHLAIVGRDKRLQKYKAYAHRLGIDRSVTFFGQRRDVRRFYQLADVCIIPSYYDPCANVTLEAAAMGVFVISSRWNGGHEILTPETGMVIEDLLDPDSVAETIEHAAPHRKTGEGARRIRASMRSFEYVQQYARMLELAEGDIGSTVPAAAAQVEVPAVPRVAVE